MRPPRAGRLSNFTGIDAPYEVPTAPALVIATADIGLGAAAERLAMFVAGHVALPGLAARLGAD